MGLTKSSTGNRLLTDDLDFIKNSCDYTIALAGNPNVRQINHF